jgi:starch phosphorylase
MHLVAAEAGWDRAAEMGGAVRAAGRAVDAHVLPPWTGGEPDGERLEAELALVSAAVRASLADGGPLLLADERGAMAVPERLRVLLDERGLGWDEAWAQTRESLFARLGSPKTEPGRPFWSAAFLERTAPRLLEILYEVNRRFLDDVAARWPNDQGRRRRLSLFHEGEDKRLRPGILAVLAACRADVATPWEGPAAEILDDLLVLLGRALHARPTPVRARAWLAEGNPEARELLDLTLGAGWMEAGDAPGRLETLAFDPAFRGAFRRARRRNRERLSGWLTATAGVATDPDALVDVRVGALRPNERPLLSALGLVREHLRITAGGWTPPARRTVVVARAADAAGSGSDRAIDLLRAVADVVNRDERAAALRVAVLPACDEEGLRLLASAADLSNQPGTAGSGAAGARALGFAVNGSVTLGTRDGTVRELEQAVGGENLFLFGLGPLETRAWREGHVYRPQDVYAIDPLVRLSLDALVGPRYAPSPGAFDWVREELLDPHDPWLAVADFGAYVHRQDEALAEFADPRAFTEKAILTLARTGRFWEDRLELQA